ncbi:MAG: SH3 domain-containing protein [Alphaproteobacteria bacterium]
MSPEPVEEQEAKAPVTRTLAYQQAISQPREEPKTKPPDIPAFETVTEDTEPVPDATGATNPAVPRDMAAPPQDMAALRGEGVPAQPPAAEPLPWATDQVEQWGDQRQQQDMAHGRPPAADAYAPPPANPYGLPPGDPYAAQRDPYAQQQDPYAQPQDDPYAAQDPYTQQRPFGQQAPYGQNPYGPPGEEWVQVVGSGTGMRATASIDAPILFAFPYGRQLKIVSRNDDWVEVSDPNTSAKGWMPAHALAPSAGPNAPGYGQQQAYEEEPQQRRGLFRRGGFADMINRAFGGRN